MLDNFIAGDKIEHGELVRIGWDGRVYPCLTEKQKEELRIAEFSRLFDDMMAKAKAQVDAAPAP